MLQFARPNFVHTGQLNHGGSAEWELSQWQALGVAWRRQAS